ncbi:hypothetical protein ACR6C2_44530 [Streptomyces sp. INA 01156]
MDGAGLGAVARPPEFTEGDVCLTAGAARDERPHRLAVVADGDLRERLASVRAADGAPVPGAVAGTVTRRPRTVFVLPGQGGLRPGQGRELYDTAPVYRTTLDEASALVGAVHGRELTAWCVDGGADASSLAATEVAQPLLVAHGVALARQLAAWGCGPTRWSGTASVNWRPPVSAACCRCPRWCCSPRNEGG